MSIHMINPASMGGEPASYSNGMLAEGAQKTVYTAGQIGIDANGVASADVATQCRQAWANIEAILAESGMGITNIVKTTIFLVNPADYATFVEVRKGVLKGHKPASTLVYVSGLVKPEWKVEIEAIAVK
ncbi:RidA family protein [Variovorax terrae]|uniref:RidA family protein n=1 Tax=Variovorax terrae TaxID=2923278 RepID=A0A9X1VXK5_9BURK|nr:RidA family protein [Variovorax terrae]MCJ0764820.1 RidA family protein [Variovorax terrae]